MVDVETDAIRAHLLGERRPFVAGVLACADHTARTWGGEATTDRVAVAEPFESCLRASELYGSFPDLLAECVEAGGASLSARPVADPPYVVVTSVGVLLRATLSDGRLVVTLRAFEVDRSGERPHYVRGPSGPEAAVEVELRGC
jgi:hypothetical protein